MPDAISPTESNIVKYFGFSVSDCEATSVTENVIPTNIMVNMGLLLIQFLYKIFLFNNVTLFRFSFLPMVIFLFLWMTCLFVFLVVLVLRLSLALHLVVAFVVVVVVVVAVPAPLVL